MAAKRLVALRQPSASRSRAGGAGGAAVASGGVRARTALTAAARRTANAASGTAQEPNAAGVTAPGGEESLPRWTFLTNHAHVLLLLSQDSSLVLREVAARIGITERAVQRIISDLEEDGFLEREKVGRQNQYRIRTAQALRHPIEAHRTIGDLIDLVSGRAP